MKNVKKRLLGLLMAGLMVCLPAMQALAQTYDVSVMDPAPVLFPGDELAGIVTPLALEGEPVALGEEMPAVWTNDDKDKVYTAAAAEDGSIQLTLAGYELDVTGGTSVAADETTGPIGGHYVPTSDEIENLEEGAPKTDRAYYPAFTIVKIRAEEPDEGMEFEKWTVEPEDVILEDELSSETTVTLPEKKVSITANYRPIQTETQADPNAEGVADPNAEGMADPNAEGVVDPNAEGVADPNAEGEVNPNAEGVTDPNAENVADPNAEGVVDPNAENVTDPNAEGVVDPNAEGVTDPNLEGSADPAPEGTGEPDVVVVGGENTDPNADLEIDLGGGTAPEYDTMMPDGSGTEVSAPSDSIFDSAGDNEEFPVTTNDEYNSDPEANPVETGNLVAVNGGKAEANGAELTLPCAVEAGTVVTLTAEDREGSLFTGWAAGTTDETGAEIAIDVAFTVNPDNPLAASFEMPDTDVTITATYELIPVEPSPVADPTPDPTPTVPESEPVAPVSEPTPAAPDPTPAAYPVTVTYGTVDVQGAALAESSFQEGATVTVTAADRAAENLQFSSWAVTSGNAALADAYAKTTTFTMPAAAVTLTANYAPVQTEPQVFNVTVTGGVVTATGAATGSFAAGTVVQLQANAPDTGMKFSKWSAKTETGEGVADSLFSAVGETATNFTVPASNVTVTAEYIPVTYKIRVNDGTADYEKAAGGTKVKITADEAPEGMEFDYWKVDSGNMSLKNSSKEATSFTMPFAKVEVSAHYRMKEYRVTVQNGKADSSTYYMGQEVSIYSNYPASGRVFDQWQAVSGKVTFADASRWKTTFKMPASDVTVTAAYKDGPSPESNQVLDLVAGGEYITDSTIKFTAAGAGMDNSNPNPGDYRYRPTGYQIGNVTGSWQASPYTTSMSIKARGDYVLKVNYTKDVFDGTNWVSDGTTDTRSVNFRVLTPAEAVATGDETPIMMTAILAGASCLLFLLLLSVFIRRRKNS